nr:hypothetical protein [Allofustis seminis]
MLLTIFVVCSLVFLPLINFNKTMATIESRNFIHHVQTELHFLQSYSIIKDKRTRFSIFPEFRTIKCTTSEENYFIKFPRSVEFMGEGAKIYNFEAGTGNLGNFNRMRFRTNDGQYIIKFQLGSGRFDVEKID